MLVAIAGLINQQKISEVRKKAVAYAPLLARVQFASMCTSSLVFIQKENQAYDCSNSLHNLRVFFMS